MASLIEYAEESCLGAGYDHDVELIRTMSSAFVAEPSYFPSNKDSLV